MKRFKKILLWSFLIIVLVVVGIGTYLKVFLPNVGDAPNLKVEQTPERIARGKYLANAVCVCMDCHGTRDWSRFSGPMLPGSEGKGGEVFDQKYGFPGRYVSKNITPFGIGNWTDGEVYRAITAGVNKDGKALFPVMPFHYYGQLADEDIYSIIAYLRTLPAINFTPGESISDFPVNFIINTMPHKGTPMAKPDTTNTIAYGKYMATAGGCAECHTPAEKGQIIAGKEYSGGREFPFPDGSIVRSANITPDASGLGSRSVESFVSLFHARCDSAAMQQKVAPGQFNTIMPWTMYGKMTDRDLSSIFAYLKSVPAIHNEVEKFSPAKK